MRKSKILLAGIIAFAVCGMLTACGKEKEEVVEETKPTMYAKEKNLYDDSENETDEEAAEQTDISETNNTTESVTEETAASGEQETADEMTEEKAIELCKKAYETFSGAEDMAEIAGICDMELYYYFETGRLVDDIEELTVYTGEFLKTESFPVNLIVNSGVSADDVQWDSATKLSRKKTTEWNKFIREYMKDNFDGSPEAYEFEEIWAVNVYETESDSSEETTQDSHVVAGYDFENPMFLVVKRNGGWKTDLLLPMTRQIFNGLTETPVEETEDAATDSADEEAEKES